jgi:hypothetical protein
MEVERARIAACEGIRWYFAPSITPALEQCIAVAPNLLTRLCQRNSRRHCPLTSSIELDEHSSLPTALLWLQIESDWVSESCTQAHPNSFLWLMSILDSSDASQIHPVVLPALRTLLAKTVLVFC